MTLGIIAEILKMFPEERGFTISIVGSGGKTTLMRSISKCLPGLVVCTTSTKLSEKDASLFETHLVWEPDDASTPTLSGDGGSLLVTGPVIQISETRKLDGLKPGQLEMLKQSCEERRIPLIIEADGSKRKPLKAPSEWEPVIPTFSDLVIMVVGLAGLNRPLNEDNVFRSKIFAELTGLQEGDPVDIEALLCYLQHPSGGLKGIPPTAKRFVVFNLFGCEPFDSIDQAGIRKQLSGVFDGVVFRQ